MSQPKPFYAPLVGWEKEWTAPRPLADIQPAATLGSRPGNISKPQPNHYKVYKWTKAPNKPKISLSDPSLLANISPVLGVPVSTQANELSLVQASVDTLPLPQQISPIKADPVIVQGLYADSDIVMSDVQPTTTKSPVLNTGTRENIPEAPMRSASPTRSQTDTPTEFPATIHSGISKKDYSASQSPVAGRPVSPVKLASLERIGSPTRQPLQAQSPLSKRSPESSQIISAEQSPSSVKPHLPAAPVQSEALVKPHSAGNMSLPVHISLEKPASPAKPDIRAASSDVPQTTTSPFSKPAFPTFNVSTEQMATHSHVQAPHTFSSNSNSPVKPGSPFKQVSPQKDHISGISASNQQAASPRQTEHEPSSLTKPTGSNNQVPF
ncbi:hypothetical protein BDV3_001732 [Batrachochytrium dendrobatidis]